MSFDVELVGISKSYEAVKANQGVNLHVRAGTIHALVGENGAGKSTAMKILFGLVQPDAGEVRVNGQPVNIGADWTPRRAFVMGLGMVQQHFMLAGPETVHDNLVLGVEESVFGVRRRRSEEAKLHQLMKSTGFDLPLDARVDTLPLGLQSRCEILKVLYRKAKFLILDEPTAVLTPQEISDFLTTLKRLRTQGHTILIVTHKLKEVIDCSDEVTVLRNGKTVATVQTKNTTVEALSELMVGRRLQMPHVTRLEKKASAARLTLSSLELFAGKITGIAGVEGNGQENLIAEVLAACTETPLALIPSDRHKEGLVLSFTLTENLRLKRDTVRGSHGYQHFGRATAAELTQLKEFDVRPSNPQLPASALSGGNQQKLIVARELHNLAPNSVVLAIHPTRGVDLGSIEFIHRKILEAATLKGAAVLLISSELDELMALSHQIGVLHRNQIAQWYEGPPYDECKIGMVMLSGSEGMQRPAADSLSL